MPLQDKAPAPTPYNNNRPPVQFNVTTIYIYIYILLLDRPVDMGAIYVKMLIVSTYAEVHRLIYTQVHRLIHKCTDLYASAQTYTQVHRLIHNLTSALTYAQVDLAELIGACNNNYY